MNAGEGSGRGGVCGLSQDLRGRQQLSLLGSSRLTGTPLTLFTGSVRPSKAPLSESSDPLSLPQKCSICTCNGGILFFQAPARGRWDPSSAGSEVRIVLSGLISLLRRVVIRVKRAESRAADVQVQTHQHHGGEHGSPPPADKLGPLQLRLLAT